MYRADELLILLAMVELLNFSIMIFRRADFSFSLSMAITALKYDGIPVSFGLPIPLSNSGLRSPSSFLPFVAGYGVGYVLLAACRT
jgi:hypothetical protein